MNAPKLVVGHEAGEGAGILLLLDQPGGAAFA
jgi:hypothetical protein